MTRQLRPILDHTITRSNSGQSRLRTRLMLAASLTLMMGSTAFALPTGGQVAAGGASLSTGPGSLTVNQSSQNAVINWQSFNIANGEAVQFVQPNANSVALNRVLGPDPSSIFGSLSANGKVFVVNPNGVLFAPGSQVNVGGLVASTLNITDANFMKGDYSFSGAGGGAVLNCGTITVNGGGYVALLGGSVGNNGVIVANLGSVVLAGGRAITLDVAGNGLLNVTVNQGAVNALVQNGGMIRADGGQVMLTAQAAGQLLKTAVNNTGVIEARSVGNRNGVISLLGDTQGGQVDVSGALDASGAGAGQTGGHIVVTGAHVALLNGASLDASGDAGGGAVLVGGGFHGKDASVANASSVDMGAGSTIAANAITTGNGGDVVLWSGGQTNALGAINARGGALSGNGGQVETSGAHVTTGLTTLVNTLAPHGQTGMWLLDPVNYTIATSGGDETPGSVTISLATSNRLIQASNDITVADAVTWTTAQTLELNAGNDVIVNAAMTASTSGSEIDLVAGHNVQINGVLTASGDGSLIELDAGHDVNIASTITASGGGAVVFKADMAGVPGPNGGTVNLDADFPVTSTSKTIFYSPPGGYGAPTLYDGFTSFMWVFVGAQDKVYDGTDLATATLQGNPPGIGLTPGTIAFADPNVGPAKTVNYSGYGINGADAGLYALFAANGVTTAAITPAALTVTADNEGKIYGQVATLSGTAFTDTGLVNGETIGSVSKASAGAAATASVAGGPYAITPSDATGGTFNPANYTTTYVNGVLTVSPAALILTADDASKVFGQTATFAPTAFTQAGLVNGETVGGVTETSPGAAPGASVAGGPYAITPTNATGGTFTASNYAITYANGALTITPAQLILTVTADDLVKTYGQTVTFAPTAFTSVGLVNGDTIGTVTETSVGAVATASVAGGPYAIVPSNAAGGTFNPGNYTLNYVNGVLTVIPAVLTVTADNGAKVYGQLYTPATSAFTSAGLVNGDVIGAVSEASTGDAATAGVAGAPYAITPSNASGGTYVATNYVTTYVPGALTVTPAALVVTANDQSKVYGQVASLPGSAFTDAGLVNGDTIGSVTEASSGSGAGAGVAGGPYAIVASDAVGGSFTPANYATTYVNGALTVTPAALVVTADDATKVFGASTTLPGSAFSSVGLVNGDTIGAVTETSPGTTAEATVEGGPYAITPSNATGGTFIATNYETTYSPTGELTVTAAAGGGGAGGGSGGAGSGGGGAGSGGGGAGGGSGGGGGGSGGGSGGAGGGGGTGGGGGSGGASPIVTPGDTASDTRAGDTTLINDTGTVISVTGGSPVLTLAVIGQGVRMPAFEQAVSHPVETAQDTSETTATTAKAEQTASAVGTHDTGADHYVQPLYARKQDRN